MPTNLPPQLEQVWRRLRQALAPTWTRVRGLAQGGWAASVKTSQQAWRDGRAAARQGWISFRDSWTKQDWFAGIKPLPAGMAGNLGAIAIVVGLVLTSLVYGEFYDRWALEQRLIPSGEHPSQQTAPPEGEPQEPTPEAPPPPVPETATPEASPAPAATAQLPQLGEAFLDRFDSPSPHERWYVSDGWSNGDYMENDWQATQIRSGEGGLKLILDKASEGAKKPLSSGEIRTIKEFRYGYFEARLRVPRDPGLIAGFFTYADRKGGVKPNEIDIEFVGRDTRRVELTLHVDGKPSHTKIRLPFDAAEGLHAYAFDWQPGYVRWYVDGKMVHEVVGGPASRLTRPQQLFFDLWSTRQLHHWAGEVNMARAPWTMQVACVAYEPTYRGKQLCG